MKAFNVGAAYAAIAIAEAERAVEAMSSPTAAHTYSVKKQQEAIDAAKRASYERLEALAHKRRAEKLAAEKKAATSGRGWRVLDRSHAELEAFARNVWDLAFMGVPFPHGWSVQWADLNCAPTREATLLGEVTLGRCVREAKLVLIDYTRSRRRTAHEFLETVLHELVHVQHPAEIHGSGFKETLRRVVAHVLGEPDAVAEPAPTLARPRPEPRKGARWGHAGWYAPPPGLDPSWEYRG